MRHTVNSLDCPCGPLYKIPCDECQPPLKSPSQVSDCWRCGGKRLLTATRWMAEETELPVLVVHRRVGFEDEEERQP